MAGSYFTELNTLVYVLAGLYGVVLIIPIIQLIRLFVRLNVGCGMTTQKLFFLLIFLSCSARLAFFLIVPWQHGKFFMVDFSDDPVFTVFEIFPSALFFTTYTLLILFWAEIIHHARNQSLNLPQRLRSSFLIANLLVYLILGAFFVMMYFMDSKHWRTLDISMNLFLCFIFIAAAFGFLLYGGKLYKMLKQFPIESRGRTSKLKEVGWVSIVCKFCFIVRAILLVCGTFYSLVDMKDAFIGVYYGTVEVVPSLLVLFILRKLPPKRRLDTSGVTSPFLKSQQDSSVYRSEENYKLNWGDIN
eukprot:TRINITY_DN4633_c0_g1_i1.p1 TRINITY_DN4633_c0_g1~~TRINITY_DN4633_c0_g1_i1.p1  ORF type:complete len:302 (-),score=22.60 TRINITY_DN4633_c0_g1_i1:43-948(-)